MTDEHKARVDLSLVSIEDLLAELRGRGDIMVFLLAQDRTHGDSNTSFGDLHVTFKGSMFEVLGAIKYLNDHSGVAGEVADADPNV